MYNQLVDVKCQSSIRPVQSSPVSGISLFRTPYVGKIWNKFLCSLVRIQTLPVFIAFFSLQ